MRLFLASTVLLVALFSCKSECSLPEKDAFRINAIDTTVVDIPGGKKATFLIDVIGPENGSEGSEFLVSLDVVIKAETEGGAAVKLADGGRVEFRATRAERIGSIDLQPTFEVPDGAPDGIYIVNLEVIDNIAGEKLSETVEVDFGTQEESGSEE